MQAIYARQSKDKKDSLSIETQIELCKQEIGGAEFKVYVDQGFSGKNTDRPQFIEMMNDIKRGVISGVTVYKLDRLSRSILDFANMIDVFRTYNVGFQSTREKFDTQTPMGNAMLSIIMVFAQLERETIQLRVKDSYYARMSKGAYDAQAPFGYVKSKMVVGGKTLCTIEPCPINGDIIREEFHKYAYSNSSLGTLARELNKRGIPSPSGSYWDSCKLSRIFSNPIYVRADADVYTYYANKGTKIVSDVELFMGTHGCITYGKWERNRRKFSQVDQLELAVGLHEGLVDSTTFLKCQYKMETNQQVKNTGKGKYTWLSGLMKCAYCGKSLKVVHATHVDKTACSGQYNYGICDSYTKRWTIPELEHQVSAQIFEHIEKKLELVKHDVPMADYKEAEYKAKIVQCELNIDRLVNAMIDGSGVTIKYLNEKLEKLEAEKQSLELEYQKHKLDKTYENDNDDRLSTTLMAWPDMTLQEKAQIAQMLIKQIKVGNDQDGIVIDWKYDFE